VESENRTVFSACHEFLGESTLSFDPSPAEATPESGKANDAQTPFPAGLAFRLALTQDIDVATAAAGDPIRAQLTTPIQDHSSKVLSPSGAAVSGRIAEVRHYYPPTPSWSIVLRLETLKIGGASRPFAAVVDEMSQRLTGTRGGKGVLHWKSAPGTAEMVFGELKPGEAVPSGQEMKWVTVWPSTVSTTKTEPATSQTDPVPAQFRIPQDPTARDDGSRPGLVPADALAPVGPRNLGFQEGAIGAVPAGWDVPTRSKGYSAELRGSGCKIGPMCATILVPPHPPAGSFGNLMQSFDGRPYRGKTIRLHAWLRVDPAGSGNRAQLWVRVDRENGQMGFFDNMGNRPVTSGEWKECEIRGKIDRDAGFLNIGVIALGKGAVWIDGISFEVM
jgi:hypothetical protein